MNIKDFEKNLTISIDEAVERGVDMYAIIGCLQYIQMALVRSMQDVTRADNEEAR